MAYSQAAAQAIVGLAGRMGVDPGALAGLIELESGGDPNIWGGAGKRYRGLIQFGDGARKEVGLPDKPMTVEEQIPYVEKYFQSRGFTPGKHGVREMYRTVLVGNPYQSGTDSFGTNSDAAAKRMLPGGDLYQRGLAKLQGALNGVVPTGAPAGVGASAVTPMTAAPAEPPRDDLTEMALAIAGSRARGAATAVANAQRFAGEDPLALALTQLDPQSPEQTQQIVSAVDQQGADTGLGLIEYLTGDTGHSGYRDDHGGSNYHEHLAFSTTAQRDAAIAKLKANGIQIGSMNDGKHAPGSYHYKDLAFDVPASQVPIGQERELSRRVRAILGMR